MSPTALPPHVQSTSLGISAPPSSPTAFPPPRPSSSSIIPVVAGLVSVVLLVLVGVLVYRKLRGMKSVRLTCSVWIVCSLVHVRIKQCKIFNISHFTDQLVEILVIFELTLCFTVYFKY